MSGVAKVGASAGLPPADAPTRTAHAAVGKIQSLEDHAACSPRAGPQHSPASQPSTAPSTPSLSFKLDGEGHSSIFFRCISGASTIEPVAEQEHDEDSWDEDLPPLPVSRADQEAVLEEKLLEVKELYRSRFGGEVDDESDGEPEYDADGTPWIKHVGTGPLTVSVLEDKIAEVKELYRARFGRDLDGEREDHEYDEDGTPWVKSEGAGPITVQSLEDKLAEVKELYREAFGEEADAEPAGEVHVVDTDGTLWLGSTGRGALTLGVLEERLDEVKELYEARFGTDVDEPDDDEDSVVEYDQDGTPWIKTVGTGPLTVCVLEDRLEEVKELFRQKFGWDADDESEAEDYECDADGTPWVKCVGAGPLSVEVLEGRLEEVKVLFQERYGQDVDEASDDGLEYDEEGTPWIRTVGTGPLTLGVLEERLAEVKGLYRDTFGRDADSESEEGSECEYDADGTPWVRTVGEGPLTVSVLEDGLAEVKALYRERYGRSVDEESEAERVEYDEEGTMWIGTVGQGAPTCSVLEERLEEVKELYEDRFGRFVEEESEDEEPDLQYDREGTLWFKWEGTGAGARGA